MNKESDTNKRLIVVEMLGSVSWFFMDSAWMLGLPLPAKILAVTTVSFSLLVFRYTQPVLSQMLVTAAMASWALMNICWMLSDLNSLEGALVYARLFFLAGTLCLVGAVLTARASLDPIYAIIARFRRLRMISRTDRKATDATTQKAGNGCAGEEVPSFHPHQRKMTLAAHLDRVEQRLRPESSRE